MLHQHQKEIQLHIMQNHALHLSQVFYKLIQPVAYYQKHLQYDCQLRRKLNRYNQNTWHESHKSPSYFPNFSFFEIKININV
jgi:hypothetical protein